MKDQTFTFIFLPAKFPFSLFCKYRAVAVRADDVVIFFSGLTKFTTHTYEAMKKHLGFTEVSFKVKPKKDPFNAYVEETFNVAQTGPLVIALALITERYHNCSTLASSVVGKRFAWPDNFYKYLLSRSTDEYAITEFVQVKKQ